MAPPDALLVVVPAALVGIWWWGVWVAKVAIAQRYQPWRGTVVRLNRPEGEYDISEVIVRGADTHGSAGGGSRLGFGLGLLGLLTGLFGLATAYVYMFGTPVLSPRTLLIVVDVTGTLLVVALVAREAGALLRGAGDGAADDDAADEAGPPETYLTEGTMAGGASVVVPVYDADPEEFMAAVETWLAAVPYELVAVIDHGDTECIRRFRALADDRTNVKCLVTPKPGKRQALVDGTKTASGDVVVLVDHDVTWRSDTLAELLKPFVDPDVGAVAPKQVVGTQETLAQKLHEVQLRLQFGIDAPALSRASRSQSVVSGRTAAYRREAILPVIDSLTDETFLWKRVISGDDEFLTRAVQRTGWDAVYQSTSVVEIGAARDLGTFLRQTLRWTRNTIRSDLKAVRERWIFRRRGLAYHTTDRFVSNVAILMAPLFFAITIRRSAYLLFGAVLLWWLLSRLFKMHPFIGRYPHRVHLVPVYVLVSFVQSPIYLYALFSANTQEGPARGDDGRFGFDELRRRATTVIAAVLTALLLGGYLYAVTMVTY